MRKCAECFTREAPRQRTLWTLPGDETRNRLARWSLERRAAPGIPTVTCWGDREDCSRFAQASLQASGTTRHVVQTPQQLVGISGVSARCRLYLRCSGRDMLTHPKLRLPTASHDSSSPRCSPVPRKAGHLVSPHRRCGHRSPSMPPVQARVPNQPMHVNVTRLQ